MTTGSPAKAEKGGGAGEQLMRPAAGLEAEFSLFVDDRAARPEDVFGDPRGFLRVPLMHRTGRSFHLPTGAAVYFDTGVIELATPVMELERGCFARLARSLDESLALVRSQLDAWERRTGHRARLQGFSAHYNVSPRQIGASIGRARRFDRLAWLLAHVLPAPVMLLATNRLSTGVGVRPRPPRLEITSDFSPDPWRMAATGAVIAGITTEISTWRDLRPDALVRAGIPIVTGFTPRAHTSRRGWLARFDCFPANPFACDPDDAMWDTTAGRASLRGIAVRVWDRFESSIGRFADPVSRQLARRIVYGTAASWLDEDERPDTYDDVGRGAERRAELLSHLGYSRYEQIVLLAVARRPLRLADGMWVPEAVRGWSRIVFRRADGARRYLPLDALVPYLDHWAS
jgi:hypothetical protein